MTFYLISAVDLSIDKVLDSSGRYMILINYLVLAVDVGIDKLLDLLVSAIDMGMINYLSAVDTGYW